MAALANKQPILWAATIATLICCFTPLLTGLFVLVGLGALVGYLDFALVALAGFFVTILALVGSQRGDSRKVRLAGMAALIVLAFFFGRFNLVFPLLIAGGAAIALLVYLKSRR